MEQTPRKLDARLPKQPLRAEHVIALIERKRSSGRSAEDILEAVETWLYNVAVAGGVIDRELHGASVSTPVEAGPGFGTRVAATA